MFAVCCGGTPRYSRSHTDKVGGRHSGGPASLEPENRYSMLGEAKACSRLDELRSFNVQSIRSSIVGESAEESKQSGENVLVNLSAKPNFCEGVKLLLLATNSVDLYFGASKNKKSEVPSRCTSTKPGKKLPLRVGW